MNDNQQAPVSVLDMPEVKQLAQAHGGMTADEIAEHALCLAGVIVSQESFIRELLTLIQNTEGLIATQHRNMEETAGLLRQVRTLHSVGQKSKSRSLLAQTSDAVSQLASILVPAKFDASRFVPTAEAWPEAFNPEGSAK